MPLYNPSSGGSSTVTWTALANLNAAAGVAVTGAPFFATADAGMDGTTLVLRGVLNVNSGTGANTRVFDVPAALAAPAAQRRLLAQCGGSAVIGLNFKADRTVELAVATGSTFINLDGCSIPGWT